MGKIYTCWLIEIIWYDCMATMVKTLQSSLVHLQTSDKRYIAKRNTVYCIAGISFLGLFCLCGTDRLIGDKERKRKEYTTCEMSFAGLEPAGCSRYIACTVTTTHSFCLFLIAWTLTRMISCPVGSFSMYVLKKDASTSHMSKTLKWSFSRSLKTWTNSSSRNVLSAFSNYQLAICTCLAHCGLNQLMGLYWPLEQRCLYE